MKRKKILEEILKEQKITNNLLADAIDDHFNKRSS